jgi:hypothetical protein
MQMCQAQWPVIWLKIDREVVPQHFTRAWLYQDDGQVSHELTIVFTELCDQVECKAL